MNTKAHSEDDRSPTQDANPAKIKKSSSGKQWESHCAEALCRLAGLRVLEHTERQACNAALETQLAAHISADRIGTFLAAAFKLQTQKTNADQPRRTSDTTPHRLFRSHHIAHIVRHHMACLISKPSILIALGTELETAILADLTPAKIRRLICHTLDTHVPPPTRKRGPRNTASVRDGAEMSAPSAPFTPPPKNGGPPV